MRIIRFIWVSILLSGTLGADESPALQTYISEVIYGEYTTAQTQAFAKGLYDGMVWTGYRWGATCVSSFALAIEHSHEENNIPWEATVEQMCARKLREEGGCSYQQFKDKHNQAEAKKNEIPQHDWKGYETNATIQGLAALGTSIHAMYQYPDDAYITGWYIGAILPTCISASTLYGASLAIELPDARSVMYLAYGEVAALATHAGCCTVYGMARAMQILYTIYYGTEA